MPLTIGTRIGPYTVVAPLGAGGMGEVYRARDAKLNRDVALKVLSDAVVDDPSRRARFEREAQALAALNHPHIAHIYGVEESSATGPASLPTLALVMELVEGPTLADVIRGRGRLPVDETITIARQVAEALEAAHATGIVHRDLKPANIKVRPDGVVKVLDFGLARMSDPAGQATSDSPTFTSPAMTAHGVILGTAAYMAPEQARGRPVDERADIWAFGCVLYEMLSGEAPFGGETVTDILAAVVREEAGWSRLPADLPEHLRYLLRRCLKKDVRQRLQAIGEARIMLDEIAAGTADSTPSVPASRTVHAAQRALPRRALVVAALAGVVIGISAAGLVSWSLLKAAPLSPPVTRFTISLPASQAFAALDRPALALSDDGRQLAYVATTDGRQSRIYLRPMDGDEARVVAGTENGSGPFFSPDGQWLGFFADGKLKKVAARGGEPQSLTGATNSFGATWAGDHTIAFVPLDSAIQKVADEGGTASPLTQMLPGETSQAWPVRLPGGAGVLFTSWSGQGQAIAVQPLGGGGRKDVLRGLTVSAVSYAQSGHLVYAQNGTLMALPFDLQRLLPKRDAPPVPTVMGVFESPGHVAQFSLANNGSLAYLSGQPVSVKDRLVWVSRSGAVEPLSAPERQYYQPRLSPDGRRVVSDISGQVWLFDIERGTLAPFTDAGSNRHAVWTPDSKSLVFQSDRDGTQRIYWQPVDGSGKPQPLMSENLRASDGVFNIPYSISADGVLTYVRLFPTRNAQFWSLRLPAEAGGHGTGNGQQFLEASSADGAPEISPDGHWLAYASDESGGGREIYVRPMSGPGGPWQISTQGGNEPHWNPKGKEIFFRSGKRMMAVDVDTTAGFKAGKPHVLFEGEFETTLNGYVRANYDVSADGQRFLMIQSATPLAAPTAINVVLNWSEELKRLVPAGQ